MLKAANKDGFLDFYLWIRKMKISSYKLIFISVWCIYKGAHPSSSLQSVLVSVKMSWFLYCEFHRASNWCMKKDGASECVREEWSLFIPNTGTKTNNTTPNLSMRHQGINRWPFTLGLKLCLSAPSGSSWRWPEAMSASSISTHFTG